MSDFLAEARIVVRPDTTRFRAELASQLIKATQGVTVPVSIAATGAGVAAVASVTSQLVSAQKAAAVSTATLTGLAQIENTELYRQAILLESVTSATLAEAGAEDAAAAARKRSTASLLGAGSASAKLDAALLGLRTAVGSTAVIGLGALALAAIAAGKAISTSLKNFVELQQQLATFRVISGASADEMTRVSDAAIKLGNDVRLPAVSAVDAAQAITELSKAGLSVQDSIAGATGVLELATAAQIDNAAAAKLAANALNAFGLEGDQATRVADDFANAANAAQGSISDIGLAFQQASAVARQVNLSLEDTTAILALFAKNGLQGSDAGTSLRVALIKLVAPTAKARKEINKLGIEVRDAQGAVRPDVFAQFGEATKNLAPSARDAAAALIFGQDAIRAVSIGAREGTDGLRLMQFQIDQTGTAADVAGARAEGLGGSFSALKSGLETTSVEFGKLLSLGLDPFVSTAADAVTAFNKIAGAVDDLVTSAANADTPLGKLGDRVKDFVKFGAPFFGPLNQIRAGLDKLGIGSDETADKIKKLQGELENLQKARIAAEQGGERGTADQLTKEITALRDEINRLKKEGDGIPASLADHLQEAVDLLEKVRATKVSLNVDTSGIDKLIVSLKEQIPVVQHVEGNMQRLRDDYLNVGDAAKGAASATDVLTAAIKRLSHESAVLQADLLRLQTEGGTPGQQIGLLQADIAKQRKIIEDAQKLGANVPGTATTTKRAREQILRDKAEIDSLQADIDATNKAAADKKTKIATDALAAFQKQKELARQQAQNLIGAAANTPGLEDDIAAENNFLGLLEKQKKQIVARIKNAAEQKEALAALQAIINTVNGAINRLNEQQKELAKKRRDTVTSNFDKQLRLAELRGNRDEILAALNKSIADADKRVKAAKTLADRLTEEIAKQELVNQKNELLAKSKEDGNLAQKFFFEQLQAQQGFAANLLGNLIPSSATTGLVGGQHPVGAGLGPTAAAQDARANMGFTSGQGQTTNSILRDILQQLQTLNGEQAAPEARRQRMLGHTSMDGGLSG